MADLEHYDRGEPFVRRYEFRDTANALADPTTVTATAVPPEGAERTYTVGGGITKISTGIYELTDTAANAIDIGRWYVIAVGTGAVAARVRDEFIIDPRVPSDLLATYALTTIEAAEAFLDRIGATTSGAREEEDKAAIADLVNGYSLAVQNYINRRLRPLETNATKKFRYNGRGYLSLAPFEARTVTTVVQHANLAAGYQETLTTNDYELEPDQPLPEAASYLSLRMPKGSYRYLPVGNLSELAYERGTTSSTQVAVTGNWGALSVPEDIKLAVHAAIAQAYRRQEEYAPRILGDATFADAAAAEPQPFSLPQSARALLSPYRRPVPQLTTMMLSA